MEKLALFGGKPIREQYLPYGRQWISEDDKRAVNEVLDSDYLTTGPKIVEFEQSLCNLTGAKYSVAVSSGTAALHAACDAVGIKGGDEVIVSSITFVASANCVLYMGGKPIFADIKKDTWNIDPDNIEKLITPKTKAVIAVDFAGQAVEVDEIKKICKRHSICFIQDAAHSLGTKYKGSEIGGLADLTIFSFHPVKTITAGEGGAILTNKYDYFKRLCTFRNQGIIRDKKIMNILPFRGYNEQILLGYNYRLTDFQAALGNSQLKRLEWFSTRRKIIAKRYDDAFAEVPQLVMQKESPNSDTTKHLYIIKIKPEMLYVGRNELFRALNAENIGLQVHYAPVYYHKYYQELGYKKGICPIAEELYEQIITIPIFPKMSDDDVEDVISAVKKVINYYRR